MLNLKLKIMLLSFDAQWLRMTYSEYIKRRQKLKITKKMIAKMIHQRKLFGPTYQSKLMKIKVSSKQTRK